MGNYSYEEDWDAIYGESCDLPWQKQNIDNILQYHFKDENNNLRFDTDARILDIGCGAGTLCEELSKIGYTNITGIDVSKKIIERCPKDSKVTYSATNVFQATGEYDVVICWFLLHHIQKDDVDRFWKKLNELCAVNGTLIISWLLPKDNQSVRSSYFSTHSVFLYSEKDVIQQTSSYFEKIMFGNKTSTLTDSDKNNDPFSYQSMEFEKSLEEKIEDFKRKYIKKESEDKDVLNTAYSKLLEHLLVFSQYAKDINSCPVVRFKTLYRKFFKLVSRYICAKVYYEDYKNHETSGSVILKFEAETKIESTYFFSVSQFRNDANELFRPCCRFNEEIHYNVKSRAYDLFALYQRFLKDTGRADGFTLSKFFSQDPKLPGVKIYRDNTEGLTFKNIGKSSGTDDTAKDDTSIISEDYNFNEFLDCMFLDETKLEPESETGSFKSFVNKEKNTIFTEKKATSFLCINLGVVGYESWGTLMIEDYSEEPTNREKICEMFFDGDKETKFLQNIKNLVFILKKIYYDYYDAIADRKIKIEAIKSAVAAIMARNMSHNLGSHYLTNTKNYFRNTVEQVLSNQLNTTILSADYRGNARLLQYIQERMDFIATIISNDQYPLSGLNFKAEFFDILTNDDCGARHSYDGMEKYEKNFLLQYLLYSEHLTRKYDFAKDDSGFPVVELRVRDAIDKEFEKTEYTGKQNVKKEEKVLKNKLSELRLAVPGGIMARHALFTIVENMLRNSAKHNKIKKEKELILTIKIMNDEENNGYKLLLYDNCGSANIYTKEKGNDGKEIKKRVKDVITEKINSITIIDKDGKLNKNDKGLKEMLICAIWLRNENLSETLYEIQEKIQGKEKYAEKYIKVLAVDKDGNEVANEKKGNLCYSIPIDKWEEKKFLNCIVNEDTITLSKEDFFKIHADFIIADEDYEISITEDGKTNVSKKLSCIFPRFVKKSEWETNNIINKLINSYNIVIEYPQKQQKLPDGVYDRIRSDSKWKTEKNNILFFDHILNADKTDEWESEDFKNAEYVDSISGENFTSTLIEPTLLENDIFKYKVIDSAIAPIAIVDERIWGIYHAQKEQQNQIKKNFEDLESLLRDHNDSIDTLVLALKKIDSTIYNKVMEYIREKKSQPVTIDNIKEIIKKERKKPIGDVALLEKKKILIYTMDNNGNIVDLDKKVVEKIKCRFVSIHLGLLDKYPKEKDVVEDFIKKQFQKEDDCHRLPFVTIHSGRGNFSSELDKKLKDYPFISLSALESALNNSKYLLSEFFNNINYYGKGNLNHK